MQGCLPNGQLIFFFAVPLSPLARVACRCPAARIRILVSLGVSPPRASPLIPNRSIISLHPTRPRMHVRAPVSSPPSAPLGKSAERPSRQWNLTAWKPRRRLCGGHGRHWRSGHLAPTLSVAGRRRRRMRSPRALNRQKPPSSSPQPGPNIFQDAAQGSLLLLYFLFLLTILHTLHVHLSVHRIPLPVLHDCQPHPFARHDFHRSSISHHQGRPVIHHRRRRLWYVLLLPGSHACPDPETRCVRHSWLRLTIGAGCCVQAATITMSRVATGENAFLCSSRNTPAAGS